MPDIPSGARVGAITVALAALATTTAATAQQASEPRLLISLFGGLGTGRPLWEINRQPIMVRGTDADPQFDTLRMSRRVNTGLVLGGSGTLFNSPYFGLSAEAVLVSLGTSDDCEVVFERQPQDQIRRNVQMCEFLAGATGSATTVALTLGGVLRAAPHGFASPYLRGEAGVSTRVPTTVEVLAQYFDETNTPRVFTIIVNPRRSNTAPTFGAAAGVMVKLGSAYQARLEVRDQMIFLDKVTGPAQVTSEGPVAPVSRSLTHNFALTVGLDIVLERRRGRRY
jgi:hypothetical protein